MINIVFLDFIEDVDNTENELFRFGPSAKSLQVSRTVTDDDADADILTITTGL